MPKPFYTQNQKVMEKSKLLLLGIIIAFIIPVWGYGQTTLLFENFDGVTAPALPEGWIAENTSGSGTTWRTYSVFAYSTPNCVAAFGDWQPKNEWLFSPVVAMEAGVSYRIGFYYRTSFTPLQMQVKMGGGQSSGQMETQIYLNENINHTQYQEGFAIITPQESGDVYFGWNVYDGGNNGNIFMDDISIVQLEAVPLVEITPAAYNFGTISVNETAEASFIIHNLGGAPLVITGINVESPFFAEYEGIILPGQSDVFWVLFDPEQPGNYSQELTFSIDGENDGTNSLALTGFVYATVSGFFEDFEASADLPDGWSAIIESSSGTANVSVYQAGQFYNHAYSGERAARLYNATTNDTLMLVTPELANLHNGEISFWTKVAVFDEPLIIGTLQEIASPEGFHEKATITSTDEYQQYTFSFEDAPFGHVYVAFMHGTTANLRPLFIDDIEWTETPAELFPPRNLEIHGYPGGGGAELFWEVPEQGTPLWYNVYRDDQLLNTEPVYELYYDDFTAETGVMYSYYVTAVYESGESGPSNIVEYTPDHGYQLIYASAGDNGDIDPEGVIDLNYGDDQDFDIVAHTGYHIESVLVDNIAVEEAEGLESYTYSFVNVTDFHEIHAEFAINTYNLVYEAGANGELNGELSQVVEHGADGSPVEAVPDQGYRFVKWSDEVADNPRTDLNVTEDIAVTALFELGTNVDEAESMNPFSVYPNPAMDMLYVLTGSDISMDVEYTVYDLSGRAVLSGIITKGTNKLDISQIRTGIYLLEIRKNIRSLSTHLFEKQ
ncbi:MAG: T9SS C-terminal target domain-containing protein [Bacteroidetes bacterium]|nr:MAG: T9SS C-terminal target domain-containing protein [Bacteroidota bacterium]